MIRKLNNFFYRIATGKTAILAAVGSVLFLVPYFAIPYKALLAKGILIDQTFNFSTSDVHRILSSYTVDERAQYIRAEVVDLFIPLVTFAVAIIIAYGFKRMGWKNNLVIVPLAAGLFNDLKTLLMFPIILGYPHESASLIALANGINMVKIPLLVCSILLLIISCIAMVVAVRRPSTPSA